MIKIILIRGTFTTRDHVHDTDCWNKTPKWQQFELRSSTIFFHTPHMFWGVLILRKQLCNFVEKHDWSIYSGPRHIAESTVKKHALVPGTTCFDDMGVNCYKGPVTLNRHLDVKECAPLQRFLASRSDLPCWNCCSHGLCRAQVAS